MPSSSYTGSRCCFGTRTVRSLWIDPWALPRAPTLALRMIPLLLLLGFFFASRWDSFWKLDSSEEQLYGKCFQYTLNTWETTPEAGVDYQSSISISHTFSHLLIGIFRMLRWKKLNFLSCDCPSLCPFCLFAIWYFQSLASAETCFTNKAFNKVKTCLTRHLIK